ncbi:hypothetical protein [Blautia sp. MSK.20.85]
MIFAFHGSVVLLFRILKCTFGYRILKSRTASNR